MKDDFVKCRISSSCKEAVQLSYKMSKGTDRERDSVLLQATIGMDLLISERYAGPF